MTVLQHFTKRLGVHKGAIAAAGFAQHVIAVVDLGHFPTAAEYSEYWCVADRTAWRHRANCEAVFGDEWRDVVLQLAREVERKRLRHSPGVVLSMAAA